MKNPKHIVLSTLFLVAAVGCRVPLKKPPIDTSGPVPVIDWRRTAEFAEASGHAYNPTPDIEAAYGAKNIVVRDLSTSAGRYFIYYNHKDKTQTLAIRGTANKANAISDIDSIKIPDLGAGVFLHKGFRAAALELYKDMTPFLQPDYKTRITGHSLGGAMAVIIAMYMVKDGYPVDEVLTFGQPKVTNEEGGKNWTFPYVRMINSGDVVAQVPPSTIEFDFSGPYEHFGPEITLSDKTFTYSPAHVARDILADDLWKTIKPDDVSDHFIKNYIDKLNALK